VAGAVLLVLAFSVVTPFVSIPEQGALAVALLALRLLEPSRRSRLLPYPGAVLLGLLATLQLLVKSSAGGFFLGVALLVAAVRPGRATRVPTVLASFGLGLAALWLLSGQHLDDLVGWARGTAAVASGYGDAMALWGLPEAWLPLLGLLGLLAWRIGALAREDLARRWPQVLLLVAASWFFLKVGFVRLDTGHVLITFVGLAGLLVWFRWTGWLRLVGVAAALVAVPWLLAVAARGPDSSPRDAARQIAEGHVDGAQAVAGVTHQVVDREEHRARLEQARQDAAAFYEVSPAVVEALADGTVNADPWDVAAVWGNDLMWQPLPVFQTYSVYEPRLDDLNADLVRGDDGPGGILRTTGRIDGRFQPWEPPRTQLEVACRYRVVAEDERWQALVRTDTTCGAPVELATVDAAAGGTVPVPEASDDEHLVVGSFSDPRGPVDALADVAFKPFGEHVVQIDGEAHRWIAATAGQLHLLRVPDAIDGEALPDAGLAVDELAFADAVRITFAEVPIEAASP